MDRFRPNIIYTFINDMKICENYLQVRFLTDDTQIMKEISCVDKTATLNNVQNNMVLHEDKFDLITHRAYPHFTLWTALCQRTLLDTVALHCIRQRQLRIWNSFRRPGHTFLSETGLVRDAM